MKITNRTTVAELIEELKEFNPEAKVHFVTMSEELQFLSVYEGETNKQVFFDIGEDYED